MFARRHSRSALSHSGPTYSFASIEWTYIYFLYSGDSRRLKKRHTFEWQKCIPSSVHWFCYNVLSVWWMMFNHFKLIQNQIKFNPNFYWADIRFYSYSMYLYKCVRISTRFWIIYLSASVLIFVLNLYWSTFILNYLLLTTHFVNELNSKKTEYGYECSEVCDGIAKYLFVYNVVYRTVFRIVLVTHTYTLGDAICYVDVENGAVLIVRACIRVCISSKSNIFCLRY